MKYFIAFGFVAEADTTDAAVKLAATELGRKVLHCEPLRFVSLDGETNMITESGEVTIRLTDTHHNEVPRNESGTTH